MRVFTKYQIKEMEKARRRLLKEIEVFEEGIKFMGENYIIRAPFLSMKGISFKWIDDVKDAINDINVKNNKIGGKTIHRYEVKTLWILGNYLAEIKRPIIDEFGYKNSNPVNAMIDRYADRLWNIVSERKIKICEADANI